MQVWLVACLCLGLADRAQAFPALLGDLDADGQITVLDLVRLLNHLNRFQPLPEPLVFFADLNQDGIANEQDAALLTDIIRGRAAASPIPTARVRETSPSSGEANVAVTRETVFRLNLPLATNTVLTGSSLYAEFGGRRMLSRIELSSDRRTLTLFYLENLPAAARIRVTLNGTGLLDFMGRPVDFAGDGTPGGIKTVDFDTLSTTPIAGTVVVGTV